VGVRLPGRETDPILVGDEITPDNANYRNNVDKTSEVGSYPANHFGLYDTHGNIWEWVEDCWNESYSGAPNDGRAWTTGNCTRRVRRGGSWSDRPGCLRSAHRDWLSADDRSYNLGFRVARPLSSSGSATVGPGVLPIHLDHRPTAAAPVRVIWQRAAGATGKVVIFFERHRVPADGQRIGDPNRVLRLLGLQRTRLAG
jgi:hypothetical protein